MSINKRRRIQAFILAIMMAIPQYYVQIPSSVFAAEKSEENIVSDENTITSASFSSLSELMIKYERNKDQLGDALSFIESKKSNESVGLFSLLDGLVSDNNTIVADATGLILLSCVEDETFEGYTILLNGLSGNDANLTGSVEVEFETYYFCGLGKENYPFCGTIKTQQESDTSINMVLNTPFFNIIFSENMFMI